jgi:tryptophanyl-tRNA synthetase
MNSRKRIFSGIQPSGNLHIGNYLGAIKNWVKLQDEYDSIFCVVDLHAITVPQNPEELQKRIIEVAKIYLASGIDSEKSSIFIQSHVSEHAELCWILNTITKNGDLTKMTQLKDKGLIDFDKTLNLQNDNSEVIKYIADTLKIQNEKDFFKLNNLTKEDTLLKFFSSSAILFKDFKEKFNKVGVGLFDYPILMAADILLYNTQVVPVGEDQLQHIEITRTLANRFNKKFGETFVIPEPFITKEGMRIMGLDDPSKKMSKSAESEYNYIALTDDAETIKKKIKKAVTDSGSEIKYAEDKPALYNLINIYSGFSGKSPKEIEKMYAGKNYSDFKTDLAEVIIKALTPIQEKMANLSDEKVLEILKAGAAKVRPLAKKKLDEVKQKIGFIL